MSTYKTNYFKNKKKIENTLWLEKLINQFEKKVILVNYEYIQK